MNVIILLQQEENNIFEIRQFSDTQRAKEGELTNAQNRIQVKKIPGAGQAKNASKGVGTVTGEEHGSGLQRSPATLDRTQLWERNNGQLTSAEIGY